MVQTSLITLKNKNWMHTFDTHTHLDLIISGAEGSAGPFNLTPPRPVNILSFGVLSKQVQIADHHFIQL